MLYLPRMEDLRFSFPFRSSQGMKKLVDDLSSLPRPRVVRFTNFGRLVWTALICGWSALMIVWLRIDFFVTEAKSFDRGLLLLNIIFPLFSGVVLWGTLRAEFKNRKLLADGSLTLGTVTAQRKTGRGKTLSEITYEFKDSTGALYQRKVQDHTNSYFPGMLVLVFYDATDPSRSVAICSTYLRVVERDGQLFPRS